MRLRNKEPKALLLQCNKCSGALEINSVSNTAQCSKCGINYVLLNTKQQKQNKINRIIEIVEKERDFKRNLKSEKVRIKLEKERQERIDTFRILIGLVIFLLAMLSASYFFT